MNKKTNTIFFRQSVKEKNADGNLLSWFSVQFNRALDVMNQAVTSPGGLLQPGAKENIAYLTSTERRLASLWFWILSRSNTLGVKSRKIDTFMRRDAGGWGGGGGGEFPNYYCYGSTSNIHWKSNGKNGVVFPQYIFDLIHRGWCALR